jgi:hypothetical protein
MWRQIGVFTLTPVWQYSRPIDGVLFRVKHLNVTGTGGQIAQCVVDQDSLQLFEKQRLFSSDFPDLFEFVTRLEPGKRRIAVRADSFSTPWRVAIECYEGGNLAPDYVTLHNAHLIADSPHPQYLLVDAFYRALAAALADKVTTSALAAAIADKVTTSALAAALADKVTTSALAAALADKVTTSALAAALADKVTTSVLAAALADKVTTSALAAALADKVTTSALAAAIASGTGLTLTAQTTDATLTEMVTPQRVLIHANSSAGYEIRLTGHSMGLVQEFIYWLGSGAIYRGASPSSTILQTATGTKRSTLGNGTNWTPTISADTVNGGLKIQVKGDPLKTIKWVAIVQLTEVY